MVTFAQSEATKRAINSLTPSGFEQLAYILVRAHYPHVHRLRAPDGGADIIDDGPPKRVWQVKHYDKINWSKCRSSLMQAATHHKPKRLTFVFPRDLTVREERSYQKLRLAAPKGIEVDVVTFSWFDAELDRPDLARVRARLLSPRPSSLVARPVTFAHPPVIPRYWTLRNDVLLTMDNWWREGTENVLVVVGLGGNGKSTLAQHWLDNIVGETETGQLDGLVQFSLYEHGDRAFRDFLELANRTLGVPLEAGDEVDVLLDFLAERRVLLVLDGAERLLREYAAAAPEFVEERDPVEVPTSAREVVDEAAWRFIMGLASRKLVGRVMLTTRLMPLDLDEADRCRRLDLGGLNGDQAVMLLRKLNIEGTDTELEEAAARFDGHPLSLTRLANVLRADPDAPGDVRRAPRYEKMLDLRRRRRDIFDRAFETLVPASRHVLYLLAAARGTVPGTDLQALSAAAGVVATGKTIRRLVEDMWIDQDAKGAVRLHSVARRWLAARDPNTRHTHKLHADVWLPRAESLDLKAVAERKHAQLADLRPATEVVFHLARAGCYEKAWQLLDGELSAILAGRFSALSMRSELLLEFFADGDENREPLLSDSQAQGSLLNSLANDFTLLGQPARAIHPLERAVDLGRQGSLNSLAVRLGNLALTRIRMGQLRQADAALCEQRFIGDRHNDQTNVLVAMQEHARLQALCGQYEAATVLLDEADALLIELTKVSDDLLERFSPIGWGAERKRQYVRLNRRALSAAYRALVALLSGKDARAAAQAAVDEAEHSGEARAKVRAYGLLGVSLALAGEIYPARDHLRQTLSEVRIIGIGDMEPELLIAMAHTWLAEDIGRASEFAWRSVRQARRNGNRLQLAEALLMAARAAEGKERRRLAGEARNTGWCDGPPFYYDSVVSATEVLM